MQENQSSLLQARDFPFLEKLVLALATDWAVPALPFVATGLRIIDLTDDSSDALTTVPLLRLAIELASSDMTLWFF